MGSALFFRAFAFYNVASLFAAPYDQSTASSDLGIPLSLSSYIGKKIKRSTVQESYDQILSDLHSAEELLPVKSVYQTRPSKTAVEALLARVYLNMGDYAKAGQYANVALSNYNTLTDYTTLPGTSNPLPKFPNNKEVIFWTIASTYSITSQTYAYVDSTLFSSYIDNDLRKTKWYSNAGGTLRRFQGSQAGSAGSFSGLAVNELFLIRAEAYARQSNPGAAMQDLNTLLKSRWKKVSGVSTYVDQTAIDAADALSKIVIERRKELPFIAPIRWDDLRRLNKDPKFARTLTRNLNGQIYTLAPNDNRYVYPIPADEIRLSGIEQNPR
jgi:tetratricopeptide (TPR) repeat protein